MWLEKLGWGVLRVLTPLGPRYVNPTFSQRLYLLWLFRNFDTLPVKVLSSRQQKWIDRMCGVHGFAALIERNEFGEIPVLGTLEQRPPMEPQAQARLGAAPPFAANVQQRS